MDKSPTQSESSDLASPGKPVRHRATFRFTDEQRELGMRTLALNSGRTQKTAEMLPFDIAPTTLAGWKGKPRYAELQAEVRKHIAGEMAEESDALARRHAEGERMAVDLLIEKLSEIDPKDLPNAVRNLATSRAISIDKGAQLRGEPAPGVAQRTDPEELWRELRRLAPGVFVEGTAVELQNDDDPAEAGPSIASEGA